MHIHNFFFHSLSEFALFNVLGRVSQICSGVLSLLRMFFIYVKE